MATRSSQVKMEVKSPVQMEATEAMESVFRMVAMAETVKELRRTQTLSANQLPSPIVAKAATAAMAGYWAVPAAMAAKVDKLWPQAPCRARRRFPEWAEMVAMVVSAQTVVMAALAAG